MSAIWPWRERQIRQHRVAPSAPAVQLLHRQPRILGDERKGGRLVAAAALVADDVAGGAELRGELMPGLRHCPSPAPPPVLRPGWPPARACSPRILASLPLPPASQPDGACRAYKVGPCRPGSTARRPKPRACPPCAPSLGRSAGRRSSTVEHPPCKREVAGSSPAAGTSPRSTPQIEAMQPPSSLPPAGRHRRLPFAKRCPRAVTHE